MGATNQRNEFVVGNMAVTGDLICSNDLSVDGDAAVTGSVTAASFNGVLAGVTAPIEVAEADVTAPDLWTALAALGLIVEPAE